MRTRASLFAAIAALSPLVAAAPAEAAPFQLVVVRNVYAPAEITILAGNTLEITNLDIEGHDVYSLDIDGSGRPLFRSPVVGTGGHAVVAGVERLTPERNPYAFVCSLHSEMFGNITIVTTD